MDMYGYEKSEDSIIEFGMKSSLIYGKIKENTTD